MIHLIAKCSIISRFVCIFLDGSTPGVVIYHFWFQRPVEKSTASKPITKVDEFGMKKPESKPRVMDPIQLPPSFKDTFKYKVNFISCTQSKLLMYDLHAHDAVPCLSRNARMTTSITHTLRHRICFLLAAL